RHGLEPECVELSIARWPVIPKAREMTPAREEVYEAAINEHARECDIQQGLRHPEVIVLSTAEAKDAEIVDDHAGPRDERNGDAGRRDESRQSALLGEDIDPGHRPAMRSERRGGDLQQVCHAR